MQFKELDKIYDPLFKETGITMLSELFIPGYEKQASFFFYRLSVEDNSSKRWLDNTLFKWNLEKYIVKSLSNVKIHRNKYFLKMSEGLSGTPVVGTDESPFKDIDELKAYAKRVV